MNHLTWLLRTFLTVSTKGHHSIVLPFYLVSGKKPRAQHKTSALPLNSFLISKPTFVFVYKLLNVCQLFSCLRGTFIYRENTRRYFCIDLFFFSIYQSHNLLRKALTVQVQSSLGSCSIAGAAVSLWFSCLSLQSTEAAELYPATRCKFEGKSGFVTFSVHSVVFLWCSSPPSHALWLMLV